MAEQDPIVKFVDELVKQAEITLPEEELQAYKKRLVEQVQRRLGLISLNYLDEKGLADFENLLKENPDVERVREFFSSRIPDYPQKVAKALEDFSQEYFASLGR